MAAKGKAPIPASEAAPKFQVVDEVFVWPVDGVGEVRVPLRFKMRTLRALVEFAKDESASEVEQFFQLLSLLGDAETQTVLDEMWVDDALELIQAYFVEFEKKNQAPAGE